MPANMYETSWKSMLASERNGDRRCLVNISMHKVVWVSYDIISFYSFSPKLLRLLHLLLSFLFPSNVDQPTENHIYLRKRNTYSKVL